MATPKGPYVPGFSPRTTVTSKPLLPPVRNPRALTPPAKAAPPAALSIPVAAANLKKFTAEYNQIKKWLGQCKGSFTPVPLTPAPYESWAGQTYVDVLITDMETSKLVKVTANGNVTFEVAGKYFWASNFLKYSSLWSKTYAIVKSVLLDNEKIWAAKLAKAKTQNDEALRLAGKLNVTTTPAVDNSKNYQSKGDLDSQPVVYNVGSVREAYFQARTTAEDALNGFKDKVGLNAPATVTDADDLWNKAQGSKGMFQTYFPINGWDVNTDSSSAFPKVNTVKKYGFQFLYNPSTVSMSYMGVAQTDVAYQMSGGDKVNYIPAQGNSGSINFEILLNRMYDMKYYTDDGKLSQGAIDQNLYFPRNPYNKEQGVEEGLFDEQAAIYNKGTMYDMEYLLRTLMGFTMKSQLRREVTADMGVFARRPVELHLGNKLRYRGYVSSLNVRHIMFNERMVPIMSSVSIGFNRYPDYAGSTGDTASKLPAPSKTVLRGGR